MHSRKNAYYLIFSLLFLLSSSLALEPVLDESTDSPVVGGGSGGNSSNLVESWSEVTFFESSNDAQSLTGGTNQTNLNNYVCGDQAFGWLQQYLYTAKMDSPIDIDWYMGTFQQNGTIRVMMVPPHGKNYDIQIYDYCNGPIVAQCSAGTGAVESCTAYVNGDFFVRVNSPSGDYSQNESYRIRASLNSACNITAQNGTPSKSSYACSDSLLANNIRFTNNGIRPTDYFWYYDELYSPSNALLSESAGTLTLQPGSTTTRNVAFYPTSGSQWGENGNYLIRSYALGECTSTVNTFITSYTSPLSVSGCGGSTCQSHSYSSCVGSENLYWFDSCNVQEELKENCNNRNSYGSWEPYCKTSSELWQKRQYYDYGCPGSSCQLQSSNYTDDQFSQSCAYGCSNNACNGQPTQYPDLTIESGGISFERG